MNDGWMLIGAAVLLPLVLRLLVDLTDRRRPTNSKKPRTAYERTP